MLNIKNEEYDSQNLHLKFALEKVNYNLVKQLSWTTPWRTDRHGYDPTCYPPDTKKIMPQVGGHACLGGQPSWTNSRI